MQQIILILTSADGVITRQVRAKPTDRPLQIHVSEGTRVDVQVQDPTQGQLAKPSKLGKANGKHDLRIKQVGQNLVIEAEGEVLVEVVDFYVTPNASVGGVSWDYAAPVASGTAETALQGKASAVADGVSAGEGGLASLSMSQLALGALGVAALAGGGGGGGGGLAPVPSLSHVVGGSVVAGPVVSGHNLVVKLYKADGTSLLGQGRVDANGKFSINVGDHTGVVVAQVVGKGGGADYRDEATNLNLDLSTDLVAITSVNGDQTTLNINPLATMAAKVAGITSENGVISGTYNTTQAATANADVAKAFGLKGDVTQLDTTPLINADGTANTAASALGKVLAALSGLDAQNGGMAQTLNKYVPTAGAGLDATTTPQSDVLAGAAATQAALPSSVASAFTLVKDLSTAMAQLTNTSGYSIDVIADDNIIDNTDTLSADVTTLTFKVPTGKTAADVEVWMPGAIAKSDPARVRVSNGAGTYTLSAEDITALTAGDGPKTFQIKAAGSTASGAVLAERMALVNRVDDVPMKVSLVNFVASLNELPGATKAASYIKVADIVVVDADGGTNILGLTGRDASRFTIIGRALYIKRGEALNFEAQSTYEVAVTVTGGGGAGPATVSSAPYTISLNDINEAPTAGGTGGASIAVQTAVVNQSAWRLDLSKYFTDVDAGDALTYAITSGTLPAGLTFANGIISGTPTAATANTSRLTATATDQAGLSVTQSFFLEVISAPVVKSFIAVDAGVGGSGNPNGTALGRAGEALTFVVTMSEPVTTTGTLTAVFSVGGVDVTATAAAVTGMKTITFTGANAPAGVSGTFSLKSLSGAAPITGDISQLPYVGLTANAISYAGYTVDNAAPTGANGLSFKSVTSDALDSNKADAATNKASGDVVFGYSGDNLAADERFQYSVDGGSVWRDVVSSTNVDTTNKTVTLSGLTLSGNPTVQVRAIDAAGNVTTVLGQQTISYDGAAPQGVSAISFKSVTQGAGDTVVDATTNATTGTVVFGYTGSLGLNEKFQYSVDGGRTWQDASGIDTTAKTISLSGLTLSGGPNVQVRVMDDVGNIATTPTGSQTIRYDATPPTGVSAINFQSVSSGANDPSKTDAVTNQSTGDMVFSYTGTGLASGERFQYTTDNGNTWLDVVSNKVDTTAKTITLSGLSLSTNPTVQVRAVDAAGNATAALGQQTVTFDDQAATLPTISALALSADTGSTNGLRADFITKTAAQTITATLSAAPANGEKLFGRVDGGTWLDLTSKLSGTSLNWDGVTLASGQNQNIQFMLRDAAGNDSAIFSRAYELDTTASHTLTLTGVAANATVQTNQVLQGTGAEAGATVKLLSDGQVIAEDTAQADGSFSFTLPAQSAAAHTLTLQYTDKADNTSTATTGLSVTWAAAPAPIALPRLTSLALSADTDSGASQSDGITNVAAAKLTGTGATPGATVQVSKVNGSTYTALATTATVQTDGTWSITLSDADVLSADTTFIARQQASGSSVWSAYSAQYAVKYDTTAPASAPTLVLAASSDSGVSDGITNLRNIKVSGVAEAGATVEVREGSLKVATALADATGAWSATLSNVSEATHSYTARQTDVAGNASANSAVLSVKVDATVAAPAAPVLDAASDSGTKGDGSTTALRPVLTGAGAEADATINIFDGAANIGSATVRPDGSWSFQPSADLSVGAHSLRASQTDVAGNTSTFSAAFNLSIAALITVAAPTAPVLAAASDTGSSNSDGLTKATALSFTGSGAQAGGKVELWMGSTKLGEAATTSAGVWSISVSNMAEGANQRVKARVIDAQGNTSDYSAESTLSIDRTAPLNALTLSPLAAADDTGRLSTDSITSNTTPTISGTGATAGAKVNIYNGTTLLATLTADNTGQFSGPVDLAAGSAATGSSYTLSAAEVDAAGNEGGKSAALTVRVDSAAAAPVITSTLTGLTGNPSISGTGEAGAFIELFEGTSSAAVASGYVAANGTWSVQYPQETAGTYAIRVRQTDLAGNVSTPSAAVEAVITASTVNPVLPAQLAAPVFKAGEDTGLATDGITNKTTPVITISGVDASITSANVATNLKVFDNGGSTALVGSYTSLGGGNWEFTPTTALTGSAAGTSHALTVTQTVAGNTSAASMAMAVTVDTGAAAPVSLPSGSVRYILLKQTGAVNAQLYVNEVEVYSNGVNVALNKAVTAGAYSIYNGYPASGITNGRFDRDTNNGGYAAQVNTTDNWLQIDLGANVAIDSVRLYALSNSAVDVAFIQNVDIFASGQSLSGYTHSQLSGGSGGAVRVGGTGASPAYTTTLAAPAALQPIPSAQPVLVGTGEVGATVEITDTVSGTATVLGTTKVGADGTWSFQATGITTGSHSITTKQTDVAGNVSAASAPYNFTVQTVTSPAAPATPTLAAASDTGVPSDSTTNLAAVTVQGTGTSGDTIEVFADLGAGSYQLLGSAVVLNGAWSLTGIHLTANASTALVARAKNSAGTSGYSAALNVVNDSAAPVAPTVGLAAASDTGVLGDNRTAKSAVGQVTLSGTAEAGATITIKSGSTTVGTATVGTNGTWSAALTAALTQNAANALVVTATDKAGNISANTSYTITHDSTAPTGTLTLTSGSSYGLMPTLSGAGAEPNAYVDIYSGSTLLATAQADAAGAWSAQLAGLTTAGSVALTAQQRDAADNLGASVATFNISVSASIPVQTNQAPALSNARVLAADDMGSSNSDGVTTVTQPRLTGTGAQANATVQAWEGANLVGSTTADASGNWTITPSLALRSGAHSLSITQQGPGQTPSSALSYALTILDTFAAPVISSVAGDNTLSLSDITGSSATATGTCLSGATVTVIFTNGAGTSITKTATVIGTTWTSASLSSADIATLGGTGSISVTARQSLGGFTSSASAATSATLDISFAPTTPVAISAGIASDDIISGAELPTISGTATIGATVTVVLTNATTGASVSLTAVTANASGAWTTAALTEAQKTTLGGDAHSLVVKATQTTTTGLTSSASKSITIDTVGPSAAPTLSLATASDAASATGALSGDGITNDNTPTLGGVAEKGASVSIFQSGVATAVATVQADANTGVWTWTPSAALANGNYSYTASQADAAGNASAASAALAVTVDTVVVAPVVTSTGATPPPAPVLTGTGEVGATVVITDTVGGQVTVLGSTKVKANGTWSFQATGITTGSHSITTQQTDVAGNVSEASSAYTFTVDPAQLGLPALTADSDTGAKGDGITKLTTPTLEGAGVTAHAKVNIYDNGTKIGQATADSQGKWMLTPTDSFTPGNHSIVAKELDGNNAEVKTSAALALTVDTTAAAPVVYAVAANSKQAPVVTGTAEAGATVTLTATSSDGITTKTFTTTANASGVWRVDTGAGTGALLANKVYALKAQQTDAAGNVSVNSAVQNVNYDTTVAVPVLNALATTQASTFAISGTGEAGATVNVYDGAAKLGSTTVNALGSWSLVLSGLSNGQRSLKVEQVDLAGNLSPQASKDITVDIALLSAPILAVASDSGVVGDGITKVTTPAFSGVAAANASVELWDTFNGVSSKVGTAVADSTGAWSLTLGSAQAQGVHSYEAKELGSSGSVGRTSAATALTIDTTSPSAAPTLVFTGSDSGVVNDAITNDNTPTLSGVAEAGASVSIFQNGGSTAVATVQAGANGVWTWTPTAALTDGRYSYTASQVDAAGNTSAASTALAVTVDTVAAEPVVLRSGSVRYILLKQTGASRFFLTLHELQVYSDGVNISAGKAVISGLPSYFSDTSGVPSAITDNNFSFGYFANQMSTDNWLQIDLGGYFRVDQVQLASYGNNTSKHIDVFASGQSLSGYTYSQLVSGSGGAVRVGGTGARQPNITYLAAPAALQIGLESTQPLIRGRGEVGATVTVFDSDISIGTTKVKADGTWSFQATRITSGAHSITTQQTDLAGNVSGVSPAYSFTVDTINLGVPSLAVSSDTGTLGDGITKVTAPALQGTGATANAQVDIYDNGTKIGQTRADDTGQWTFDDILGVGSHSIEAKEIDGSNAVLKTSGPFLLMVDTAAAAPVIDVVAANSKQAPVVTGTAEVGATVTLTATSTDGSTPKTFTITADASGVWRVDTGAGTGALLANKVYALKAQQTDAAGNVSVNSAVQNFNYDTTAPTEPVLNAFATTQASTFAVSGTGEVGATVNVYDGSIKLGSVVVNAQGSWSLALSGLSNGAHSLKVEQVDLAGNLSPQASKDITVDIALLSAPILAVASDSGVVGDGITQVTTPAFSAVAAANASVELWDTFNGVSSKVGTATADSTGAWSLTLGSAQAQGVHSYEAKELGSSGSVGRTSAATALTIDTTSPSAAPTLVFTGSDSGVVNDAITNDNTPTLSGVAEAGASVSIFQNGGATAVATVQAGANGAWTWTPSAALTDGNYSYTAKQLDAAGNTSAASTALAVTVDTAVAAPVSLPSGSVRYILLKQTGATSDALAVNEVQVYSNGVNVALNKAVTAANYPTYESHVTTGVTAGDLARNNSYAAVPNTNDNWVQIDLGANYAIDSISVYGLSSTEMGLTRNVDVFASAQSLSGYTYTQLTSGSGGAVKVGGTGASPAYTTTLAAPAALQPIPSAQPVLVGTGEVGATVEIFDNNVSIGTTKVKADGTWSFQATRITSGEHSITSKQTDVAGNVSAVSAAYTFTVDTAQLSEPVLAAASDTGSSDSDGITQATAQTLQGAGATANAQVALYDNGIKIGQVTAGSGGTWTFNANLGTGSHRIEAKEMGSNNVVTKTSAALALTVDTAAAAPVINAVAANSKQAPVVTGTAEANATVTLTATSTDSNITHTIITKTFTITADASGVWRVDTGAGAGALVANKPYTLKAQQTDAAGNVSVNSAVQNVNYDTTAPNAPVLNAITGTQASTFAISGTGEAGATVNVYDGAAKLGSTTVNAQGAWSLVLSGLSNGTRSLKAEQVDLAGNLSVQSQAQSVTVNTTALSAPVLAVSSDSGVAGDGITHMSAPTLTGSGAAPNATVQVWEGNTVLGTAKANANGVWVLGLSFASTPWADGPHSVVVQELNASGGVQGSSSAGSITIDTQAPGALTKPVLDVAGESGRSLSDGITNVSTQSFSGTAEAYAKVELLDNGSVVATGQANSTGQWRIATTAGSGAHSYTVRQTDAAGNVSAASAATAVTVDTQVAAPVMALGGVALGSNPFISGTAEALASVTVGYGSGQVTVQADAQGIWRAQLPLTPNTATSYILSAVQTDVAGNVSAATAGSLTINPTLAATAVAPATLTAPVLTAGQDTGLNGVAGSEADGISSVNKPLLSGTGAQANATVQLWANGIQVASTTALANGSYSFAASDYSLGLGEGLQRLSVRQVVGGVVSGVASQDSPSLSWTVDSVANTSAAALQVGSQFGSDAQGVVYVNTTSPTLGGSAEAGAQVKVFDNGALWQTVTADALGRWTLSGQTLPTGTAHSISTQVTDVAGNTSAKSNPLSFNVLSSGAPAAPSATWVAGGDSGVSSTDGITSITSQWLQGTVSVTAGLPSPTVQVYDNGTLVGSVQAAATGNWAFNVTGLADGGHVLTVRSKDAAGSLSVATTVASFTVDTTAPTALSAPALASGQDTGSNTSDGVTSTSKPTVSGTAEAGSTVELYVDGALAGSTTANTTANTSTGAFSVSPTQALGQGTHSLTLVQVDAAGNRSSASAAKAITVDSVIAGVSNLSLLPTDVLYTSAGEWVTTKARPTVQGFGEAGATVTLKNGASTVGTATVGPDGVWRITPSADLSASNSLTATQTDAAGNISNASAALNVAYNASATVPTIALQAASDTGVQGDGITSSTRPVLVGGGVSSGVSSGDTLELYNGGNKVGSITADANGNWALSPSAALADGTYTLSVKNATKNAEVGSLKVQVLAQAGAAPTGLALAADADTGTVGDKLTRLANPTIEGGGAQAGATVRVYEGTKLLGIGQADGAGQWRVQTTALSEGEHSITAVQVNAADVASVLSVPLSIRVDSQTSALTAPTLRAADDSGLVGDNVTHKTSFTVTGSGAEANAWVSVRDGDVQMAGVQIARVQAQADGTWSAILSGLTAGAHSLRAQQTDAAGNTSVLSAALALAVVVDNAAAAPTVALDAASQSSLSQPGYTMQAKPTFKGQAEAGATVSVYDASLLLGTAVVDGSGNWSLTSTVELGLGTHSNVFVVQTDVAGNTGPASRSVAVTVLPNVVAARTYAIPGSWTFSLSSGDLNGDGAVDLYAAESWVSTKLLLGDGTGLFTDTPHNMPKLAGGNANTAASVMVDFNGDGRMDVMSLPFLQGSSVLGSVSASYFVNRGGVMGLANLANAADGYVRGVGNNAAAGFAGMQIAGDLNGDGLLDFAVGYGDNALASHQTSYMLSTRAGVWRQVFGTDTGPQSLSSSRNQFADVNGDGRLDAITAEPSGATKVWLTNAQGTGYTLSADLGAMAQLSVRSSTAGTVLDLNGDGALDVLGVNGQVAFGRGDGSFTNTNVSVAGAQASGAGEAGKVTAADVNADGRLDLIYVDSSSRLVVGLANGDGSYTNNAAAQGWDPNISTGEDGTTLQVVDVNGDRSLDLVVMGINTSAIMLNNTAVAENTYLRVVVANDHGGLDAYGASVRLYDHSSGALVAVRAASSTSMALSGNAGSYGADFFGLDPAKSYDVVVVYPGSDSQVTVLTGKAGLGVAGIKAGALKQIVDSSLTAVTPGGKDVVWVAKENRSTSSTGGYWQGTGLADQMVGDLGADVFKPNGARIGELGDTLTGGGGKDRYVFDVKAALNTGATITDFTATAGTDADSIDMGALLSAVGYSGARTAAGVAAWVQVTEAGGKTKLQVDAHTGTGGVASGFVDLVTLNGVTGNTLAQLVSGGFVHLGGVQVSGVAVDQTVTETASRVGVQLASGVTISAEGGQWAAGFNTGKLLVSLDGATADDTMGFGNVNSVTYDAGTRAVMIAGTTVATVDATQNGVGTGVGTVGKLLMTFDFATAGANYSTEAQQAAAVQAVMQSLKLSSASHAPSALDRAVTFTLTDALGDTVEVYSGLRITPEANNATLNGVNYITGTESVETLAGTAADETIIGYNGVPTAANTANLGSALTFGDTLTGGGGKDTFKWLSLQLMNSDASDKITDFGLKGGTNPGANPGTSTGQGAAEADVLDLSALLKGYTSNSAVSDFIKADVVGGKVQIQVDFDGKANGSAFEKTWFMTLDNLSVNASNQVLANNAMVAATPSGNLTLDTLVQQMMADSQFKLL